MLVRKKFLNLELPRTTEFILSNRMVQQPNDEHEQDRMDLAHHIYLMLTGGKLYLSPIQEPQRVLDLGTGTGN